MGLPNLRTPCAHVHERAASFTSLCLGWGADLGFAVDSHGAGGHKHEQFGVETDAPDAEPGVSKADEEEDSIVQAAHTSCNTKGNILHFGLEVDALSGVGIDALCVGVVAD